MLPSLHSDLIPDLDPPAIVVIAIRRLFRQFRSLLGVQRVLISSSLAMLLRHSLTLLGVLGGVALGDIEFTNPTAGATLTGGFPVDVHWADSGDAPSIADLTSYQLLICAGSNDNEVRLVA